MDRGPLGPGMRGAQDDVAAFQCVHAIEQDGDVGVGGGDHAGDDALGMSHKGQVAALVTADDPHGLLAFDGVPHAVRRAGVLGDLVRHIAQSRLGHSLLRQFLGMGRKGLAAHAAQFVDLLLGVGFQLRQRLTPFGDHFVDHCLIVHDVLLSVFCTLKPASLRFCAGSASCELWRILLPYRRHRYSE